MPARTKPRHPRHIAHAHTIGQNVRVLREAKGMSKHSLARRIGLQELAQHRRETGERMISAHELVEYAAVLGCTVDRFFRGCHPQRTWRK